MDLDIIFIVGPQGSGKGTQAKILAERLGFFHWDMGAVLREESGYKLLTGETVGQLIDKGVLLVDRQLLEVFRRRMASVPRDRGVVFDGIPRRIGQAQYLINFLREQGRKNFLTLFLEIPKEETLKRLLLRAQKENRKDDTRESIEFRLEQYEKDTKPILEYLKTQTTFIKIDGRPSIPEVTQSINGALGLK